MQLAGSGHAEDVSAVVASPLITSLRNQETELLRQEADLSSRYGPRHPKMLDLESQKRNLEGKIKEEVNRVVETTKSDVMVARAHVASLEASLSRTSSQSRAQGAAMAKLAGLEATAQTAQTLYQTVLSRYNDAQSQSGFQTPDTRVLSRGVVPDAPSSPKKARDLAVGIAAGLVLGLVLAFTAEHLDIGFRTATQIESQFGVPVLATVLELKSAKKFRRDPSEQVMEQPASAFTEAMRGIDLGLSLGRSGGAPPRLVVVTSAVPAEGKTTVAAGLARLNAEKGRRVLLIDADLRKPGVARAMGLRLADKGLVEALSDPASWQKCLMADPKSKAMVLPCLRHTSNAAELLGAPAMQQLLKNARAAFDLVVVDTAPLLPVHDSWVIAGLCDAALLVARWERTPREAISRAVQILRDMQAPVGGIVLMRADSEQFHYYNYGYQDYREYNKYYTS
jgi:capsular exopolysaccharide synthesis family protein